MGQVSSKLRRGHDCFFHWCPACEEMHPLPDSWTFDGDLENPTFHPSFRHTGLKTVKVDGEWTGDWVRDADGKTIPLVCHYNLIAGKLQFCNDCTHSFGTKEVDLPQLPEWLKD